MGIIKQGILGGFSGKVAGVVGSSWKGIAVMKAMPLSVANPNTAEQQEQRGAFSNAVAMAKELLAGIIKPCWDRFAQKMSGYNAWIKSNVGNFDKLTLTAPADLTISEGVLILDAITSTDYNAITNELSMDWSGSGGTGNALDTDEVYAVAINEEDNVVHFSSAVKVRSDDSVIIENVPDPASGKKIYGYLAFRRVDGTIVSNTDYGVYTKP